MRTKELLLECKVKLGVKSDYALAQGLKVSRSTLSYLMDESRKPDEYVCFKIAECLGRDPALVIAEIRAEEGEKHADYFRDFIQRQSLPVLVALSVLTSCAIYTPEASAASFRSTAERDNSRVMGGYVKRRRGRFKDLDRLTRTAFGRFFYARQGESVSHAAQGGRPPAKTAATWQTRNDTRNPATLSGWRRVSVGSC